MQIFLDQLPKNCVSKTVCFAKILFLIWTHWSEWMFLFSAFTSYVLSVPHSFWKHTSNSFTREQDTNKKWLTKKENLDSKRWGQISSTALLESLWLVVWTKQAAFGFCCSPSHLLSLEREKNTIKLNRYHPPCIPSVTILTGMPHKQIKALLSFGMIIF